MLISLLYVSDAVRPAADATDISILNSALSNNEGLGLTGFLLRHDRLYFGALEGERDAVETMGQRLRLDPRHRRMEVLLQSSLYRRQFPTWSMGFADEDPEALPLALGQREITRRNVDPIKIMDHLQQRCRDHLERQIGTFALKRA